MEDFSRVASHEDDLMCYAIHRLSHLMEDIPAALSG